MKAGQRSLLLSQLERTLDAHVRWYNANLLDPQAAHLPDLGWERPSDSSPEINMREVHSLASVMKDTIAKLRNSHLQATAAFSSEVERSQGNLSKVNSVTQDLKSANHEVELMLGETGSNFPTSEDPLPGPSNLSDPDKNGVQLNPKKV